MGASCPEAVASEASEARQIKRLVAEAVDDLISGASLKRCRLRQAYGRPRNRHAGALPLVQDSNLVEKYSANIW